MARPNKPTPILSGKDAVAFVTNLEANKSKPISFRNISLNIEKIKEVAFALPTPAANCR